MYKTASNIKAKVYVGKNVPLINSNAGDIFANTYKRDQYKPGLVRQQEKYLLKVGHRGQITIKIADCKLFS